MGQVKKGMHDNAPVRKGEAYGFVWKNSDCTPGLLT